MKLSEATTLEELISAVVDKLDKEWYYVLKHEQYHNWIIFSCACPTQAFEDAQKKAKKKIEVTEEMLALKDMFILDHIKIDLCNYIDPFKKDAKLYRSQRKKVLKEIM